MTPALILTAVVCAFVALGLLLCHHAPEIGRGILPEADELYRPPNLCGNRFDRLTCDRAWGHDGLHADSHTGRHDRPLTWRGDAA